ncbi:GntR family transcriptional regulator [Acrocarpospora catenulata]|uniref:GntR family transcriptional regulator n=1 Tax=Acrocarpospora catenulata TaxID=2836182 RepID=UPI001BDA1BDD|nr:GntR family transcriptional regulator [Acrocarpospora catenulata]
MLESFPALPGVDPRREIVEVFATRITSGQIPQDAPMPSTPQLMARFGIAGGTAARVKRDLRDRGLIRSTPGYGYFVGTPEATTPQAPFEERVEELFTVLRERVRSGTIPPHRRVATTRELIIEFRSSRDAAEHALTRLAAKGWAYRVPFRGIFAAPAERWPA